MAKRRENETRATSGTRKSRGTEPRPPASTADSERDFGFKESQMQDEGIPVYKTFDYSRGNRNSQRNQSNQGSQDSQSNQNNQGDQNNQGKIKSSKDTNFSQKTGSGGNIRNSPAETEKSQKPQGRTVGFEKPGKGSETTGRTKTNRSGKTGNRRRRRNKRKDGTNGANIEIADTSFVPVVPVAPATPVAPEGKITLEADKRKIKGKKDKTDKSKSRSERTESRNRRKTKESKERYVKRKSNESEEKNGSKAEQKTPPKSRPDPKSAFKSKESPLFGKKSPIPIKKKKPPPIVKKSRPGFKSGIERSSKSKADKFHKSKKDDKVNKNNKGNKSNKNKKDGEIIKTEKGNGSNNRNETSQTSETEGIIKTKKIRIIKGNADINTGNTVKKSGFVRISGNQSQKLSFSVGEVGEVGEGKKAGAGENTAVKKESSKPGKDKDGKSNKPGKPGAISQVAGFAKEQARQSLENQTRNGTQADAISSQIVIKAHDIATDATKGISRYATDKAKGALKRQREKRENRQSKKQSRGNRGKHTERGRDRGRVGHTEKVRNVEKSSGTRNSQNPRNKFKPRTSKTASSNPFKSSKSNLDSKFLKSNSRNPFTKGIKAFSKGIKATVKAGGSTSKVAATISNLSRNSAKKLSMKLAKFAMKKIAKLVVKLASLLVKKTAALLLAANIKIIAIAAAVIAVIWILGSVANMVMLLLVGIAPEALTMYQADETEITLASVEYSRWEWELLNEIKNTSTANPGFDEYWFFLNGNDITDNINSLDDITHNPFDLTAFLTVKFGDFVFEDIQVYMRQIFDSHYQLSRQEILDYNHHPGTEETGDTGDTDDTNDTEEIIFNRHVLQTFLTVRPFAEVLLENLETEEERSWFEAMTSGTGGRQLAQSPFDFDWSSRITSRFGWRTHPISGNANFHLGLDIAVPSGTPVRAGFDGTITRAGWIDGYGYITTIQSNGMTISYAHLDTIFVSVNDLVKSGDIIANSGNTGNSTGAHLHMEITLNGQNLNPEIFVRR